MNFHEHATFPLNPTYGEASYGAAVGASQQDSGTGHRSALLRWDGALRRFNAAMSVRTFANAITLRDFYLLRDGPVNGFRYKDETDFTTATNHRDAYSATDQLIGTGDGNKTTFQLKKTYSDGTTNKTRHIEKPIANKVKVAVNDVEQTTGWSVDTATGIITFNTAPASAATVKAGCEFDVPVGFEKDLSEALELLIVDFDAANVPDIVLFEIPNASLVPADFPYGGAQDLGDPTADVTLTPINGKMVSVAPTTTGKALVLPDTTTLPTGGEYFVIANGGTQTIDIDDAQGGNVGSVTSGSTKIVSLGVNSSGAKTWYVY